jgi:hypothetical protein
MLRAFPLLILPLALYNAAMFGIVGVSGPRWLATEIWSITLWSGAAYALTFGTVLVLFALLLLAIDILKAGRPIPMRAQDHLLPVLVFLIYVAEFVLIERAGTETFLVLGAIALVDVIAVTAVALRVSPRDTTIGLG